MRTVEVGDYVFLRCNHEVENGRVIKRYQDQVWFEDPVTKAVHFSWTFLLREAGARGAVARWVHFADVMARQNS